MRQLVPVYALLHPIARLSWREFSVHWSTVIGLTLLTVLYEWRSRVHIARAATPEEKAGPSRLQRTSVYSGLLLMFLSLNGPLHDLSDMYLFSAHMVQHLVLTLFVPPLLIIGTPAWMFRPALQFPGVTATARFVTGPRSAFFIFSVVLAAWHLPLLYNTSMTFHTVHIIEHLMFLVASVIMWWPLLSPMPELPRLPYPGQMLYCIVITIPMSIIAIYITLAGEVLYPAYASAPRVLKLLTPLADQQLGGLIMWVPGSLFFAVVISLIFRKWSLADGDHQTGVAPAAPGAGSLR